MSRVITLDEVKKHATKESCWVVVHGHVFDMTPFLGEHPGGWEIIVANVGGKDNAEQYEEIRHTNDARKKAMELLIGKLEGHESTKFPKEGEYPLRQGGQTFAQKAEKDLKAGGDDMGSTLMVGAIVIAAATGAYFYMKKNNLI